MSKYRCLFIILLLVVSTVSCGIATKRDIARIEKGIQENTRKEVARIERLLEKQGDQITEEHRQEIRAQLVVLKERLPERQPLTTKITTLPDWTWLASGLFLLNGFIFINAFKLRRRIEFDRSPLTDQERDSLSLSKLMIDRFLDRRRIPPDDPDPDPPDGKPPLRII